MKFLKLAFIYKKHHTLGYVTFLYTKRYKLRKNQDNLRYVFIYKNPTLCVPRFFIEFLKFAEGGDINYFKYNALVLRCYIQSALHYALHFNIPKTMHFSLRKYIYIIYRVVLIPDYKRTYDQSDQIEK